MIKLTLDRLVKMDLRDCWDREDSDFTPWLAEEENITILGDAIGIRLEVQDQETSVGPFRADILCRNIDDNSLVVIENQLEKTDHTHLGQLLTYGAGLDAVTLVWLVQTFTEEHRAALDWLNRITDEEFHFFGLEIELWNIGKSNAAPKLNVVAKPNDWSKRVRESADTVRTNLTEWQKSQIDFWALFGTFLMDNAIKFKSPKPAPSLWMGYGAGRFGAELIVSFTKTHAMVHVQVDNNAYPEWFSLLKENKVAIHDKLGFSMEWENRKDKKWAYMSVKCSADMTEPDNWPKIFEWMTTHMELMRSTLRPLIKELPG
jgi:hypothetical protein